MMSTLSPTLRRASLLGAATLTLWLAGCASSTRLEPAAPVEDRGAVGRAGSSSSAPGGNGAGNGTAGSATSESRVGTLDLSKVPEVGVGNANLPRVVYFDFDSYVVTPSARNVIDANAKYLNADRARRLMIEGHTDERGGREYNLALGQKRADAVVRSLALLGVPESQTEAVSYGKERPAAMGNDESAWAKNRRAELKDR
jgi:peptidoglycan-associated lipoprotein